MWDEAERLAIGVLSRDPNNLRALHVNARCLMKAGKFEDAVKNFEHAATINPLNVERLIGFGKALLETGKVRESLAKFDTALEVDIDNEQAKKGKGQCHLMIGEVNEALTLLNDVLAPRELAALFNATAILSIRQLKFLDGIGLYNAALGALGKDMKIAARLFFNMGLAYYKDGKSDKAVDAFLKAVEADPTFLAAATNARVLASLTGRAIPNVPKATKQTKAAGPVHNEQNFTDDFEGDLSTLQKS